MLPQPTTDYQCLITDLEDAGYCLIPEALDNTTLSEISCRIKNQAAAEGDAGIAFSNPGHVSNQWVNMLLNKGVEFHQLITHPLTSRLVEHILGPDYLLSCCDAQIKHSGDPAMPLHTDQWWMPTPASVGATHSRPASLKRTTDGVRDIQPTSPMISAAAVANVMWLISDFTTKNGATVVVPGSHLSGAQPDGLLPHPIATTQIVAPAGSALVFDGRLWHAAGANETSATRYGITCAHCGPQFRPLENYTRGLRPEMMRQMSPQLLKRLGFEAWSTYGHTGDPSVLVSLPAKETVGRLGD